MIDGDYALLQRFVYFIGNLAGLGLAIYKCQVMGLLPTHPSDWLAFVEPQKVKNVTMLLHFNIEKIYALTFLREKPS